MENHEQVERELLEQCDQVAILMECFSWLQRCDECIEQFEELCRAKRPRLTIDTDNPRWRGSYDSRVQSWNWSDGSCTLVASAVINSNHIEPWRFLEDAGDVMNTAFNGEFATKDKRAKSIITKNSEIYCCTDMHEWYEYVAYASLEEFQERDSDETSGDQCLFDGQCMFAWSVVAALYPAEKHVNRESSYPHYTAVLNLAGIEFPMILKDIPKFERLNAVSINVYSIENRQVFPLRLTNDKKEKHVNLPYLHYFSSCEKLQSHEVDCQKINNCAIRARTTGSSNSTTITIENEYCSSSTPI
ncbi:PREDICTED: uncharacterized protein LOC105145921 [Acromyrmex echinatior]|uniref:uncharacterized protein LOC105145921 n=1 Tax=Acromyrmex echinatior TaxID=103372 RepID=UPI000580F0FF|nr:PREDICTED: uncharacterized protein LOC105145921 [Acromyrmex echinatior]